MIFDRVGMWCALALVLMQLTLSLAIEPSNPPSKASSERCKASASSVTHQFHVAFERCQTYFARCSRSNNSIAGYCYICSISCRQAANFASSDLLRKTLKSLAEQCEVQLPQNDTFPQVDSPDKKVHVQPCSTVRLPTVRRLSL